MNETAKATLQGIERKGEHVFSNGDGHTFANVRKSFDTTVRKSGLTDFRFHDLRHTFASNLVMEGIDIKTRAVNISDRIMSAKAMEKEAAVSLNPPHPRPASNVIQLNP